MCVYILEEQALRRCESTKKLRELSEQKANETQENKERNKTKQPKPCIGILLLGRASVKRPGWEVFVQLRGDLLQQERGKYTGPCTREFQRANIYLAHMGLYTH